MIHESVSDLSSQQKKEREKTKENKTEKQKTLQYLMTTYDNVN